jgi:hypothetical protein
LRLLAQAALAFFPPCLCLPAWLGYLPGASLLACLFACLLAVGSLHVCMLPMHHACLRACIGVENNNNLILFLISDRSSKLTIFILLWDIT